MRDADVYKQINPDDKVFTKRVLKKIRKIEMKFDIAASIMVVGIFVYGFTMLGLICLYTSASLMKIIEHKII